MKTIDITPTWEQLLPTLVTIYKQAKTEHVRKSIYQELQTMAQVADKYNQTIKKGKK